MKIANKDVLKTAKTIQRQSQKLAEFRKLMQGKPKQVIEPWDFRDKALPSEVVFNNMLMDLWSKHQVVEKVIIGEKQSKEMARKWSIDNFSFAISVIYRSDFQDVLIEML